MEAKLGAEKHLNHWKYLFLKEYCHNKIVADSTKRLV